MTIRNVVFANVSTLSFTGVGSSGIVEACTGFQASRSVDIKPVFAYDLDTPAVMLHSEGPGSASFSYTVSNGTNSGVKDWSSIFKGAGTITCSGAAYPSGDPSGTVALTGVTFAGQSIGMSAKDIMTCSVNVLFTDGTL